MAASCYTALLLAPLLLLQTRIILVDGGGGFGNNINGDNIGADHCLNDDES